MAENTRCTFVVNDDGGGAPSREFVFATIQQGDNYRVTVTNDGIAPYGVTLSQAKPTAELPAQQARVKATGTLSLLFDKAGDPDVAVSFSGPLNTTHSTSVSNVIVATFD